MQDLEDRGFIEEYGNGADYAIIKDHCWIRKDRVRFFGLDCLLKKLHLKRKHLYQSRQILEN
jgi:hypothetical protein